MRSRAAAHAGVQLPPGVALDRRKHHRLRIPYDGRHTLEFRWPDRRGAVRTMRVHDLSPGGLSFVVDEPLPGIEPLSNIGGASVRLGDVEFRADLLVVHVWEPLGRPSICGALIYPEGEEDLRRFLEVVAPLRRK